MSESPSTVKCIQLLPLTKVISTPPVEKTKRVVTMHEKWRHVTDQQEEQLPLWLSPSATLSDDAKFVHRQISTKIAGYKSQDQQKSLFDPTLFVSFSDVLTMLSSSPTCYYCKKAVSVLYDFVREPRQWTLERLDNGFGHNRENVVVACLQCNLRRRTMLSSRYQRTQEMKHVLKLD